MPKTNEAALDAFIAAKTEIDKLLTHLAALSAEHFHFNPDNVNWGHVGTLEQNRNRPRAIPDTSFREGEHAATS